MPVGTGRAQWAVALTVGFADGNIGREAKAIALAEEGDEGKLVVIQVTGAVCRYNLRCSVPDVCSHGASSQTAR
jgi:hypothetical protein